MIQVPLHGLANARLKCFRRFPAQLALNLARIDRIAAIMAGTIGDKGNLLAVGYAVCARAQFVEQGTNGMHDVEVGFFVPAADVINLAQPALR